MRLIVFSHKPCWQSSRSPAGFATDGGFPFQMRAIAELFDRTVLLVPTGLPLSAEGEIPIAGHNLTVAPLTQPPGRGAVRKLLFPFWIIRNLGTISREFIRADAVHAPIPGDVGTIGMLLAVLFRKPLFVRHCGNWLVQKTTAERFWKWFMERFAGGRNVMLATGGGKEPPSAKNPNISWIFSTSLTKKELAACRPAAANRLQPPFRLIIVCRQEKAKGTGIVIAALPHIMRSFPDIQLDVVGDGSVLRAFREQAKSLAVEKQVYFHGKVDHETVLTLLKQAHIFCYPTAASEGFPKVVVEALACGLPVITTPVSVLPELIDTGGGIILDKADPVLLAEAAAALLAAPDIYAMHAAKAYALADRYSLESWRDTIGARLYKAWGPLRG